MSNSLEGRSPFLSKYMLEWAPRLPDKEKINGLNTKFILRELAKKYSLTQLYKQPKRGFEVPLRDWVENDLKENIYDRLSSDNSYSRSFVNKNFINKLLNNPKSFAREKRAKILWNLYSLEVWHNSFIQTTTNKIKDIQITKKVNKINVLFLTTGLGLGGAERVVLDICKNINKSIFEVSVIGVSSQKNMLDNFHQNQIHAYALNYKKTISKFFNSIIEISRHIKNHNIKIIHAHMFHTLVIASFLKLFNQKLRVVFTPHNSFYSMQIRRLILWILKPFRDIDTVFSKSAVSFFHKGSPAIIPNGIDINDYLKTNKDLTIQSFTFIVIGRLELMKNHRFLIDEISKLKDYDFKVKIVGSGVLEDLLKKQVSFLKLGHKIEFLGSRNDVPLLLNQSDCLLLPSLWEAFPIVLLEAAASDIPVITTPVGSISSFVDYESGYVVELNSFRNAMIEVMTNRKEARMKSNILHKKVKSNYHISDIVKQYESIYLKIVK